jgi:hypothetical protein
MKRIIVSMYKDKNEKDKAIIYQTSRVPQMIITNDMTWVVSCGLTPRLTLWEIKHKDACIDEKQFIESRSPDVYSITFTKNERYFFTLII